MWVCSLIKKITLKICMLCFVLINSILLILLCVWIWSLTKTSDVFLVNPVSEIHIWLLYWSNEWHQKQLHFFYLHSDTHSQPFSSPLSPCLSIWRELDVKNKINKKAKNNNNKPCLSITLVSKEFYLISHIFSLPMQFLPLLYVS